MGVYIIDFDGTLTDTAEEAEPVIHSFLDSVKEISGIPEEEFKKDCEDFTEKMLTSPSQYGWEVKGKIIAPAYSDPYVFFTSVLQEVLKKHNKFEEGILTPPFIEAYKLSGTAFLPHVKETLEKLMENNEIYIVTNSGTEKVLSKLEKLSLSKDIPVIGGAKKYELDDSFTELPESTDKGFGRPLYLRRKKYYDILKSIQGHENATVVGDIYELDLLLPEYMGMNTVLLKKHNTWKKEISAAAEKGRVIESISELLN